MTRRLPRSVKDKIYQQIKSAVAEAQLDLPNTKKEDSLTGTLGTNFRQKIHGAVDGFEWSTQEHILNSNRVKGRDEEPELGADMIYEVHVTLPDGTTRTKAILIQAKSAGDSDNQRLKRQCDAMNAVPGGHLVVVYDEFAFKAYSARAVGKNEGSIARSRDEEADLSQALGRDFLNCTRGQRGMSYDQETGKLNYLLPRQGRVPARISQQVITVVQDHRQAHSEGLA